MGERAPSEQPTATTAVEVPRLSSTETYIEAPGASEAPIADSPEVSTAFATSPEKALLRDEINRTWTFCLFVVPLVVLASLASLVIGGDPTARWIHIACLSAIGATALWLVLTLRVPTRYSAWHTLVFGEVCAVGVSGAFYYWGVYSAVLLIVPFGAHIFSGGQSLRTALAINITVVTGHAALSLAIIAGAIPDRGLIPMPEVSTTARLVILALIHFIFVATFAISRQLRRSAQRSSEELERVTRAVSRRDALLAEARQDLNLALHVGGPGPYTGQRLGSYDLGPILGRGAMGEIYDAVHTTSGEPCAVKMLHPQILAEPGHYRRFLREAEIAASLDAENVVRVLEVGSGDDALPYLAMERLHGVDLSSYLKQHTRLPVPEVVELLRQIAAGLAAAHAAGIVHRDLKPQNLFRAECNGRMVWKVLDFGVSKLADTQGTLTQGRVVGTPGYMAPEQARGEEVDHLADIYALGVIAYRCLTGVPAFTTRGAVPEILYAVVYSMPQRPSAVANLALELDDVLAIAVAKDPSLRFTSGAELADAVAAAARGSVSPALRDRARAVLAAAPWGTTSEPETRS